ncbi:MAG: 50S ribosomal protein L3 [Betaproteobacteria bacterium]|nr:MAG: 50S ribosomal protein L3 [Betaproteobacteria bacterium]
MSLGLVGRKIGMTRIFSDDGAAVPVTVLDVANNRVTQIKTEETDGYSAVQVTYGKRRANRVTKPQAGHLAKAGVEAGTMLKEFQVRADELASLKLGETISVETFAVGQLVDVSGTTKGRGFSGVIQRHHFSSNRASHGNSRSHNSPGSIGMAQDPGRVFPGKRMAGQYGNVKRTVQTLKVVRVDVERGLLLVKGAVPGADGGHIVVRPSVKTPLRRYGRCIGLVVRSRIQRSADPPAGDGVSGQCAQRQSRAKRPGRHQQVAQEAVGAERHRPCPSGPGQQPAVARRRKDFPQLAR